MCFRSTLLQQQFNQMGKVETGSVALPAIMRSGAGGPESFQMGSMPQAKQHITSGQMHRGHMPPLVSQLPVAKRKFELSNGISPNIKCKRHFLTIKINF